PQPQEDARRAAAARRATTSSTSVPAAPAVAVAAASAAGVPATRPRRLPASHPSALRGPASPGRVVVPFRGTRPRGQSRPRWGGGGFRGGWAGDGAPQAPGIPFFGAAVPGIAGNGGGAGSSHVDPKVISAEVTAGDNAGHGYVLILSGADSARTFDFGFTREV